MKIKPYTKSDFAWATWQARDIKKISAFAIAEMKNNLARVQQIPANQRTFENTIFGIESASYELGDTYNKLALLMSASPEENVRKAATAAIKNIEKTFIEISYDEKNYEAVKEYHDINDKLTGSDKKLFRDMLRDYRRLGFELSKEKRNILKANAEKLSQLIIKFDKNIQDYHDQIVVRPSETAGLPESYLRKLTKNKNGEYLVTLKYPDFFPFMRLAKSALRRKELAEKSLRKGGKANLDLIKKVLKLRHQNAKLLGYANHVEFQTEIRMAKNANTALDFVNDLIKKVSPLYKKELEQLKALKQKETDDAKAQVNFYDVLYYDDKLKKSKLALDDEEIRKYFPLNKVKEGIFKIYSSLFSIKFERLSGYSLWHKDVELYAVKDKGRIIAYFMLDFYPRPKRYDHAAAFPLVKGRLTNFRSTEYVAPSVCLVTNFPRPSKDVPSLLTHDEVETFFHEFGHLMHNVLTTAAYASQSGTSVVRDFVEAPSQMLENWVWDKDMLDILSGHYKTGTKLPDELRQKLLKSKDHLIATFVIQQMVYALMDMNLHKGPTNKPANQIYNEIYKKYRFIDPPSSSLQPAGFGHFSGYDAGYYGYMWSKVYSCDMFTRFKKRGLLDKKTGADYRTWILEKGSSIEEGDILKKFLGRKPNNRAFLKDIGL